MRETQKNISPLCSQNWNTEIDQIKHNIRSSRMIIETGSASPEPVTKIVLPKQNTMKVSPLASIVQNKREANSTQNKENEDKKENTQIETPCDLGNSKKARNEDSTNSLRSLDIDEGIFLSVEDMSFRDTSMTRLTCDFSTETSDFDIDPDCINTCNKKENKSRTRRFKRMIMRPLRRSKSDCCDKDISVLYKHSNIILENETTEISFDEEFICHERLFGDSLINQERKLHKTCSADAAIMNSHELIDSYIQPKSKSKRLAFKGLKKRFQFLRRRNTDAALDPLASRFASLTHEQVFQWSKDFELLLTDKCGLKIFMDFLTSEFSEENLEFWIACQEYKSLDDSNRSSNASRAHKIYDDFVAFHAPKEINLDSNTRMTTITNLEHPSQDTFKLAQRKIQALMEKDSYPRFLESELYQQILGYVSR